MNTDELHTRIAQDLRDGFRHIRGRGKLVNEAATLQVLILPLLESLGYPATHRIPEYGESGGRIDEACFLREVNDAPGHAAVIVEVKQYGAHVDFDRTPQGRGRYGSPNRQIQRYLRQHRACGQDTIGVLTDGVKWRIYRRVGNPESPDIQFVREYDFQSLARSSWVGPIALESEVRDQIAGLVDLLSAETIGTRTAGRIDRLPPSNLADQFLIAIAEDMRPEYIVQQMLDEPGIILETDLARDVSLDGVRKDAHDRDWEAYAYAKGVPIQSERQTLTGRHAVVAAVQYPHDADRPGLDRADAALCARTLARADESGVAVVFAYSAEPWSGGAVQARMAVAVGRQVNMTAVFETALPSPSARAAITQLLEMLRDPDDGLTGDDLLAPLEVAPLRQQFYREAAQWTGRMQYGKELPQRQAILRHLVRVMFTWILREESIIPQELFEPAFIEANLSNEDDYHGGVLRFLFHRRMNVQRSKRSPHDVTAIDKAMDQTPFLNGSLFAAHPDDDGLDMPYAEYWRADDDAPGLFTILSRYHWTMDEHRPGESEQTLDPELLSNLFERLITPTEEGTEPPLRQPKGTYYTPADIADEMVKDALAAAVRNSAPSSVSDAKLLDLFGDEDAPPLELTYQEQTCLRERVEELRIFDPAVGSGVFLFSALNALGRALNKLGSNPSKPADIIRRQLVGQDIHPLAVQITRLRLFVAITAERRGLIDHEPLPNLEAHIVCADTLQTIADPAWWPDRPGRLDTADPELKAALTDLAEHRKHWFEAYTDSAKQELLKRDDSLRDRLKARIRRNGDLSGPELVGFAEAPLLAVNPTPARTDSRLLFYESDWRGFDVVIGNPPYEALTQSMEQSEIDALQSDKRYQTTRINDLYTLFCETALTLANPVGGVVTMIVPLSIAFGQRQATLRRIFESRCREIDLRHYDNAPDTPFNASPTVKTPGNSQRATILTVKLGSVSNPVISSSGLQRWPSAFRKECLAQRRGTRLHPPSSNVDSRIFGQWPRIPTLEVAEMVGAVMRQRVLLESLRSEEGETISFPKTTRYFISSIPEGTASPRSESLFTVPTHDDLCLMMAILNGHVAYGWWRVYGDGFHINSYELTSLTIPDPWVEDPQPAIDLGQRLIDAIPDCVVETRQQGNVWRNVNFHRFKPDLIEELDRLHIVALGLEVEPLLTHLRIMRSSSSWDYSSLA